LTADDIVKDLESGMRLRQKYLAVMMVPVVVLATATTLAFRADRRSAGVIEAVAHTSAVRLAIDDVLNDLVDAETGMRGYLITGDENLLDPYKRASAALPTDLADLRTTVTDNLEQTKHLDQLTPLVVERMELLWRQKDLAPLDTKAKQKIALPILQRGGVVMGQIRDLLGQMAQTEGTTLAAQQSDQKQADDSSKLIQFWLLPMGLLLSLLMVTALSDRAVKRVIRIQENALRLERGEPLLPPDDRKDEIGELSRLMVQTGTQLTEAKDKLQQLATTDPLTGLMNRRGWLPVAEHELKVARREERPLALAFVDVDGLKAVNDEYGHNVGDLLIKEVAALLRDTVRASDLVARVGGDEFCVLMTSESALDPDAVVGRLEHSIDWANTLPGRSYPISVSIGAAARDALHNEPIDDLMRRADAVMYECKRAKSPTQLAQEVG
jgi:diguanylate cyclase (GGDEF)-like protein